MSTWPKSSYFIHRGHWQSMMWSYHLLQVYQVTKGFQMSRKLPFALRALIASYNVQLFFFKSNLFQQWIKIIAFANFNNFLQIVDHFIHSFSLRNLCDRFQWNCMSMSMKTEKKLSSQSQNIRAKSFQIVQYEVDENGQ